MAIYNWKGFPNKTDMINRLGSMVEAARSAVAGTQRRGAFGHLVILLRDVPDDEPGAHERILGREDPASAPTREESEQIASRNAIRERLQESFQAIDVKCMPLPHAKIYGECSDARPSNDSVRGCGGDRLGRWFRSCHGVRLGQAGYLCFPEADAGAARPPKATSRANPTRYLGVEGWDR